MNTHHIHQDDLIGYLYRTLDDGVRESIDAHLLDCPVCRARLEAHGRGQRVVGNELNAALRDVTPSAGMSFAAISDQLRPRNPFADFWHRAVASAPMILALAGLALALAGLWELNSLRHLDFPSQQMGAVPALACFFLMLVSLEEFDKAFSIRSRFVFMAMIAVVLWLGSALIGVLNIVVIQDLAIMATVAVGGNAAQATFAALIALVVAALLYIAVVIGGAEYHYRNIGQPNSWKTFIITLLGQLFILILPYLVF